MGRLSPAGRKEISSQIAWFKRLNEYVLDDLITRLDWEALPPEIQELIAKQLAGHPSWDVR